MKVIEKFEDDMIYAKTKALNASGTIDNIVKTLKSPTKFLSGSSSWLKRFSGANSDESPFDELCQESQEEDILLCGGDGEAAALQSDVP